MPPTAHSTRLSTPARFARLWRELAATGDSAPVAADLMARWSEPLRHYHTLDHLDACLAGLDAHRTARRLPDPSSAAVIEAALWFHDAIYDPRSPDNELRSAALAREILIRSALAPAIIERIAHLILATRTHESDGSADTALLLDLDLAILGSPPDSYDRYAAAIRREYAWVPENDYRQKRAAVLRQFLLRSALFQTARFQCSHEHRARQNLAAEIARLASAS